MLVFALDLGEREQLRIMRWQTGIPELREQITDELRNVARRTGNAKRTALRKLTRARHALHRVGENLRTASCGGTSHTYHDDGAWWQWPENLQRETGVKFAGGVLRFGGVFV